MPVPRLFDIRRPSGARIVEWMITSVNGMSPISSSPAKIMRGTQRKMMSRRGRVDVARVEALEVRRVAPASPASRTARAQTRTRCRARPRRDGARRRRTRRTRRGPSRRTVVCPSGQYQTGIRWPHHSWRETHHGRIVSQPVERDLVCCGRVERTRPLDASIAGRDESAISHHHCSEHERLDPRRRSGSQWPTACR